MANPYHAEDASIEHLAYQSVPQLEELAEPLHEILKAGAFKNLLFCEAAFMVIRGSRHCSSERFVDSVPRNSGIIEIRQRHRHMADN
jgi:hypothetical protein